ncbi:MAG: mechanosensitive ion channel family protein [Synergistaceae bacterium]|nr:mechanosensitive ion channel family protein [Synergistaceae bacterium]
MRKAGRILLLLLIAAIFIALSATAFMLAASTESASRVRLDWAHMANISAERVLSPADRSSPRAAMESFMNHMKEGYERLLKAKELVSSAPGLLHQPPEALEEAGRALYNFERAMHVLDLSQIPQVVRLQNARENILLLKEILDRVGIPRYDQIPGAQEVEEQGLVRWTIPKTEIRLHRVESGIDEGRWLVTPASVAELGRSYRRVRHLPYLPGATENAYEYYTASPGAFFPPKWAYFIPAWLTHRTYGQALWQWSILIISSILFILLLLAVRKLSFKISEGRSPVFKQLLKLTAPFSLALGAIAMVWVIEEQINITGTLYLLLINVLTAVEWLGWTWVVVRAGELLAELIILSPRIESGSVDASLVRTLSRLASIAAAIGILMFGASELGVPLMTLITGFGVAGLAVSLAARPTLENIIGGLILFTDRSVKVGEFCRFGDKAGTVLHIGLRSTKIEALDQTVISIPNADFSQMQITNVSRRSKALLQKTINLRYETTRDQLRWILASIRDVLHAHPKIYADPAPFARFEGFGESSLDVLIFAYVKTKKWSELMAIQEDILFRISEIVEMSGSGFAFPSTTAYIAKDDGLDKEKGAAVEKEVQQWREEDAYPFPDTPLERMSTLLGTIKYPPKA